jgi:hypothetical protein
MPAPWAPCSHEMGTGRRPAPGLAPSTCRLRGARVLRSCARLQDDPRAPLSTNLTTTFANDGSMRRHREAGCALSISAVVPNHGSPNGDHLVLASPNGMSHGARRAHAPSPASDRCPRATISGWCEAFRAGWWSIGVRVARKRCTDGGRDPAGDGRARAAGRASRAPVRLACSGTSRAGSDADILAVIPLAGDVRPLTRLADLYAEIAPRRVDLSAYTPAEFEDMKRTSALVRSALAQGRVFHAR